MLGPQGQYWPGNGAKWKYRTYIRCRKYMNQNQRCLTCPSQPLLETLKRCFLPFSWEIVFFCLFFAFFWSPPKFLPFWRVERFYGAHTELPGGKGVVGELFYLIFSVLLPKEKKCERFEISFASEEAFFPFKCSLNAVFLLILGLIFGSGPLLPKLELWEGALRRLFCKTHPPVAHTPGVWVWGSSKVFGKAVAQARFPYSGTLGLSRRSVEKIEKIEILSFWAQCLAFEIWKV